MVHNEKLMFGDKIKCKYWNFTERQWQEDGCYLKRDQSNRTNSVCECNHLTNFAAIMDVSGREQNHNAKSILTMILCCLSIICLVMTIVIFASIKSLQNRRTTITCNLCGCLLIANILIAFGMDLTEEKHDVF